MTLSNIGQNTKDLQSFSSDKKTDKAEKENSFMSELYGMIELSVKSSDLPDDALINSEIGSKEEKSELESLNFLATDKGNLIDISNIEKLKAIASKLKMANNNSQQNNIDNNFIFNIDGEYKLFEEVNLDEIKKQSLLIDKYGSSNTKVDFENHPKIKLIRETTKDLIQQHRDFLAPFKEKIGIAEEGKSDNVEMPDFELLNKVKEVKDSNKNFFNSLKEKLNGKLDVINTNNNSMINLNIDASNDNVKLINKELVDVVNKYNSKDFKFTDSEIKNNTLIENKDSIISKFGMDNNNSTSGENSPSDEKLFSGKKLVELFLNGKISAESFNKNLSELKQVSNEIKANAKEYIIYKDVQAKNIATNTANSLGSLTPNGNAMIKMNLNPTNLGNVFVEVNVVNNVATLNFKSETKQTLKLIEHQINNLVEKLNSQGITTDSISLTQNQEDKQELMNNGKYFDKGSKEQKDRKEYFDSLKNLALLNELKS